MAPRDRLAVGAVITAVVSVREAPLDPEPVAFDVLFEDEHVIVVAKPAGIVVHPGAGARRGTLAAGLLHRYPELEGVGDEGRWGIVHRLDRETSGALLVARTAAAHAALGTAIRQRRVERVYLAMVTGLMDIPTGIVDAPIGRDPRHPTRMAVQAGGRPARTHYARTAEWHPQRRSLLTVRLETGRTHQIRVHLASIGLPVVGDRVYGGRAAGAELKRVWLHARRLRFAHPVDGRDVVAEAPLPTELRDTLARLGPPSSGEAPAA